MGEIVYLTERFPDKQWPINYVARRIAEALLAEDEKKAEQLTMGMPDQFVTSQLGLEVEYVLTQKKV